MRADEPEVPADLPRARPGADIADPFDLASWPLPELAIELEDLATACHNGVDLDTADRSALEWACSQLTAGVAPMELCRAAMWVGLRNGRTEGRGPIGLVTHSVLAAHACAAIGRFSEDESIAAMAAVQHVAYTVGRARGGINDPREGPSRLGWYRPVVEVDDPFDALAAALSAGETDLSDHAWLAAADADIDRAETVLLAAAAGSYHLNEHKLVYPAQLSAWHELDDVGAGHRAVLFRAAARYVGNHLQDPATARSRCADAAALGQERENQPPTASGDLERVSVVATGIARTVPGELEPLLIASLQAGLDPEDLALSIALVTAERFAETSFGDQEPVAAIHACTGANAIRRSLATQRCAQLRFELALAAPHSPTSARLDRIAELAVPPSDNDALADLSSALDAGDPDGASEAATAVDVTDQSVVEAAWHAVGAAAVTDQWMVLHAVKHVVAMHEDFSVSEHPARVWFLAAAARTAAHATRADQPRAAAAARLLGHLA